VAELTVPPTKSGGTKQLKMLGTGTRFLRVPPYFDHCKKKKKILAKYLEYSGTGNQYIVQ